MSRSRASRRRLSIAILGTIAIMSVFAVRLVDLQVVRADELRDASRDKRAVAVTERAPRGSIVDTNGVLLAQSVTRYDITASPRHALPFKRTLPDGQGRVEVTVFQALKEIADITGADIDALMNAITERPESDFAYLVRSVGTQEYRAVRELDIPWVYPQAVPERTYPNGAVAGNLVGFVGTDGPQYGIEFSEDACLASVDGVSTYERGADGVRLPGSTVTTVEAKPGGTVTLTIDADLQWFVQQTIAEEAIALGAESAMAIVVRVDDGHIVAAADWPAVDPNDRNSVAAEFFGARSFSYAYEPGSILKAMSAAMLIDQGAAHPGTRLTIPWRWQTPDGAAVRDAVGHADWDLTLAGVLERSSNVGTAMLSAELSNEVRLDYLHRFGFGEPTAVGFQGESRGLLDESWNTQQRYDISYGQGIAVSAAQMVSAYQALGNGGVRLPLTLVESCTAADGTVTVPERGAPVRVVSEAAAKTTIDMLQGVVTEGFLSSVLSIPGYNVAAKTGTGEVAAAGGGYGSDRIISLAGLAPADNPEFAVLVTYVKPTIMKTSAAAAPTFQKIMAHVLKTYRVPLSTQPAPRLPTTW